MMQRVPSTGYYDNIVEDHSYTMYSMYPQSNNVISDHWQLMKEDPMVRENAIILLNYYRIGFRNKDV